MVYLILTRNVCIPENREEEDMLVAFDLKELVMDTWSWISLLLSLPLSHTPPSLSVFVAGNSLDRSFAEREHLL